MSAHDIVLSLIYQIPAAAFVLIGLLTFAVPLVHLIMVMGRAASGRSAQIDWWVLGRVVPFIAAAIVILPLIAMAQSWTNPAQIAAGEVALIFLSAAMIFLPIAVPLIQAYVQELPRWSSFLYSLLAFLSLPVAAALATEAAVATTHAIVQSADAAGNTRPQAFFADSYPSACKRAIFEVIPEGFTGALPPAEASIDEAYPTYFFFWADMTLKAAFLDFFEVFECGVTNLRHNPDHLLMASFVFIYRAFVSLIVLSVITLPFRRARA